MIKSFERPTSVRYRSGTSFPPKWPTSPVRNQPSAVNSSFVLSGMPPVAAENTLGPLTCTAPISPACTCAPSSLTTRTPTPGSGTPTVPASRWPSDFEVRIGNQHYGFGHAVALEYSMAGALLELLMRFRQQRCRARDEEPHRAAMFTTESGFAQQPRVERRHAHHHRRARQPFEHASNIEPAAASASLRR